VTEGEKGETIAARATVSMKRREKIDAREQRGGASAPPLKGGKGREGMCHQLPGRRRKREEGKMRAQRAPPSRNLSTQRKGGGGGERKKRNLARYGSKKKIVALMIRSPGERGKGKGKGTVHSWDGQNSLWNHLPKEKKGREGKGHFGPNGLVLPTSLFQYDGEGGGGGGKE